MGSGRLRDADFKDQNHFVESTLVLGKSHGVIPKTSEFHKNFVKISKGLSAVFFENA
jgi:hypothetical protein